MKVITPKKDIFFRASGIGALMTDGKGTTLTPNMEKDLNKWESVLRSGGKITPNQTEKLKDYQQRRDAPPQLSDTAKTFVELTWLKIEKGFERRIKSPYLEKGIFQETESLALLSELDGQFYVKNLAREYGKNITGECDIKTKIKQTNFIDDIKSSWDALTFMNSDWDKLKEWQGRTYMKLYGGDVFRLRFVLVDAPDHIVMKQKERLWREFYHDSMTDEEQHRMETQIQPMYDQIDRNLIYSTNPKYSKEERVKTYQIERDDDKWREMEDRVEMALEYYHTITLNRLIGKYNIK